MKNSPLQSKASKAWVAFGCLAAFGLAIMIVRELPSMRREWRLMRM
jgi:hypothetical protein